MKNNLEKAREKRASLQAEGNVKVLNPEEKFLENPTSRKYAINAKCFDCVGSGHDAGWRNEIKHCPCTDCPLHNFRPYK